MFISPEEKRLLESRHWRSIRVEGRRAHVMRMVSSNSKHHRMGAETEDNLGAMEKGTPGGDETGLKDASRPRSSSGPLV